MDGRVFGLASAGSTLVLSLFFSKGAAMQFHSKKLIAAGAFIALVSAGAMAQTTAPAGTASAPAAVGVSPATAASANQKAVPRNEVGTVVRTSPSAADKARAAASDVSSSVGSAANQATSAAGSTAPVRRARADRN
jgi:hypothetical protein